MKVDIEDVKTIVDIKLKDVKTIQSVARHLHVSSETLRKSFLRNENIPLGDYIVERKVLAMKELLTISDYPCYKVCYEFGFREDTGAKVFKKITGVTMQEYRANYKKENPHK
jgi:AraC-like DNA-binding protein